MRRRRLRRGNGGRLQCGVEMTGQQKEKREDGGIEGRVVRRRVVEDEYQVVMKFKDGHDIQAVSHCVNYGA